MAASYPTSAKSFSTKATNDSVEASHVNDLQDEVTAIETALLTGGVAHNVFPSGTRTLGTSSAFWDKGYLAALILAAETTSGIRLEVNSGSLDVREGDDSALAPLAALTGSFGATAADGGTIRIPNGGTIHGRNAANSANIEMLALTGGNLIALGSDAVYIAASGGMSLIDGISAPSTSAGRAWIYVDTADGDLKVKFGDGVTKTLATDT
jgi:hypothetical protein